MLKTLMPRSLRSAVSFLKLTMLSYNRDYRETSRSSLHDFVCYCGLLPTDHVLEVGCGRGRAASGLTRYLKNGSFDGFDILAGEIDWCRKWITRRYPRFRFQHADIYNKYYNAQGQTPAAEYRFPYESEAFDFVYLTSVFTHMLTADVEHYLDEISRVLRPGGCCFASYFLLNENRETPQVRERFSFAQEGCSVHSLELPEWEVAYHEKDIRVWYQQRGLEIQEPIRFGSWGGHANGEGFQDVVIAVKKTKNV